MSGFVSSSLDQAEPVARDEDDPQEHMGSKTMNSRTKLSTDQIRSQYGKWRILRRLRNGGQAFTFCVCEAEQAELGQDIYVLKLLRNSDPQSQSRFDREVEAGRTLSHKNIIKQIDNGIDHNTRYLVTEYCNGGSLTENVHKIRNLSLQQRLDLFLSICNGVAYAHQQVPPIIHRDLKPQNIFLHAPEQIPVIGDFGLCFNIDEARLTRLDEQVGSRFYMAPEMADGKAEDVGTQCDVYSLGKVLYWLVSGGRIFDREKHRDDKYDLSISSRHTGYIMINELLDKMIVEDPLVRLPDATSVGQRIERIIDRLDRAENNYHADIQGWKDKCLLSIEPSAIMDHLPIADMPGSWRFQIGSECMEATSSEQEAREIWGRFQKRLGDQMAISLYTLGIPTRSFDNFVEFDLEVPLSFREIAHFIFSIVELDNIGTRFSAYLRLTCGDSMRWLCFSPDPEIKLYKDGPNREHHREIILPLRLSVGSGKSNVIDLRDVRETLNKIWAIDNVNVDDWNVSGLRFRGAFSLSFVGLAR